MSRVAVLSAAAALIAGCAITPRTSAPPAPLARVPVPAHRAGVRRPPPAPVSRALAESHIALLLPQRGPLSGAAQSVRDGFLTAYYQMPPAARPQVRIYDTTAAASMADLIARAAADGADFIIGPLTRPNVAAAAADGASRPPMLALNFLPDGAQAPPRFYQFALSPTAEARKVARRVLADGYRVGIAIVPAGEWGTRVLDAFTQQLRLGGGELLAATRIDLTASDYSGPIEHVLLIDESRGRLRRLESVLGMRLAFVPHRREDIQFIFAPAPASIERLLEPQLRFYYANGVPTFSTSDAFAPDPVANQDLDGLQFLDMPWMLGGGALADAVHAAAAQAWPAGGPDRGRLFAFGFDAYHLAAALLAGHVAPGPIDLDGLTGRLRLGAGGRIHRSLIWAKLQDGDIRILPPG